MDNITNEQKIYELSLIWKEAEYNFAFWPSLNKLLDWDEEYKKALKKILKTDNVYEYYLELMKFVALLRDGHTSVWFPKNIINSEEYFSNLPIKVDFIDNKYVITNVDISIKDIVKRYSVIKRINGTLIKEYIEKNIYPYIWHEKEGSCAYQAISFLLRGPLNSKVELLLEENDVEYAVTLARTNKKIQSYYPPVNFTSEQLTTVFDLETHTIKMTNDGVAVIIISSMMNDELGKEIFENYELLNRAKGYIIDIRANGGGNSNNSNSVASLFIGKDFRSDNAYHPIHIGVYKAWGKYYNFNKMSEEEFKAQFGNSECFSFYEKMYKICNHTYYEHSVSTEVIRNVPGKLDGPIIILSSPDTASAAENFINVMKYNTNALVIGSASYGSTGQPLTYKLESGGGFRICTRKSETLDDLEFINIGFKPDIECNLTIEDYKKNNDSVMNKALEVIRKMIKL